MKRTILLGLLFFLFLSCLSCQALAQGSVTENFGVMRPDVATIIQWQNESRKAPRAYIDQNIRRKLQYNQEMNFGTSISISSKLNYVPAERQQANCGNCWNWAGQGVAGIALNVQESISDRLSTQFLNSCKIDKYACCGGWLTQFADWYNQKGMFVSWSNSGASFIDGQTPCNNGSSSRQCADITTTSNHPINSIAAVTVATTGIGISQADAIANIKNVLNQNKAIWFGFFLPNKAAWDNFTGSFWSSQGEDALFAMDGYCGTTWDNNGGGGHAILLVGYNDEVAEPYWEFINSWGTANNKRPNGVLRIKMDMNYGCIYPTSSNPLDAFTFQTLNIVFAGSHPQCSYAISPPSATFTGGGGNGAINVTTTSACDWTATTTDSWIAIISGSSGTGNGSVSYSVAANTSAERTGTITVGEKQYAISQQAVSTSGQLLKNPGFEEGNNGDWTENSAWEMIYEYPCYTLTGLDCSQEGAYLAWLGGYDSADDLLFQDIMLPSTLVSASLRFWYGINSNDSLYDPWDFLEVKVIRIRDNYSKTLVILDNTQTADEWALSDSFNISEFIGESIRLQFYGTTDGSYLTNFYIDNIQLSGIGKTLSVPSVPDSISASDGLYNSRIAVSWSSTGNAGSYRAYRCASSLTSTCSQIYSGAYTSCNDYSAPTGSTYYYRTKACNSTGCSGYSIYDVGYLSQGINEKFPWDMFLPAIVRQKKHRHEVGRDGGKKQFVDRIRTKASVKGKDTEMHAIRNYTEPKKLDLPGRLMRKK